MGESFQIDSGPFLTVPATPGRISIFFRFQKKWFLGGLEMVQNPHSWGWRNSHLFWCFFRLSTCTHLKHLNNASKILWKVPQVWGFWAFVDHPKTTFFETEKKWNSAGSGRNCQERSWIDLERLTHNIWHLSIKNYAPDIIFEKDMADQKGGGYFETAR